MLGNKVPVLYQREQESFEEKKKQEVKFKSYIVFGIMIYKIYVKSSDFRRFVVCPVSLNCMSWKDVYMSYVYKLVRMGV